VADAVDVQEQAARDEEREGRGRVQDERVGERV
jgi:hypothetical protein